MVQLDWDPYYFHAPYALGIDLGLYAQEGLEIEFLPGRGSATVAPSVATDRATFGFIDASVLLLSREKKMPLKAVSGISHGNPVAVFFLKDSGIKKPKDLEGRSVLVSFKSFKNTVTTVFLEKVGLSRERVKMVDTSAPEGSLIQLLLSKKADAIVLFANMGFYQGKLLKDRSDFSYFVYRDYGVDSLNKVVVTNEKTIKENPELIHRFVRASAKSWERALADPTAAMKALKKRFPAINEGYELTSFVANRPFLYGSESKAKGLPYMSPKDWQETQELLVKTGLLPPKSKKLEDSYTNKFIR